MRQYYYVGGMPAAVKDYCQNQSLKAVRETNPATNPVRFSMAAYRKEEWLTNVPLYQAHEWMKEAE